MLPAFAAVMLLATTPAPAQAATPKRVYACVTKKGVPQRLSTKKVRCRLGQHRLTWNITGPAGTSGSPDTAAQVLDKLKTVDGSGSGLDADLFGGIPLSGIQRRVTGTCPAGQWVGAVADDGTVTCSAVPVPLSLDQASTSDNGFVESISHAGTGGGLKVRLTNASGGGSGIDVLSNGFGAGVFSQTTVGHSLWGIASAVGSAAVLGDHARGEGVVARTGGGCTAVLTCSGIGAVVGRNDGQQGIGVRGFNTAANGFGVLGQTGISGGTGVALRGENVNAANTGNAVEAVTNNATGSALFAQGTKAATFNGNVTINGNLTVTGSKSGFHIDDPRAPAERTLTHTPVETDALTVVYTGNVRTGADGRATVRLPSYAGVLAGDWRYQLTPIGRFGQAIVEREIRDGRFVIRTEHPRTKVSWAVTGLRHDAQARDAPIVPVQAKTGADRGRYIDPSLYGKPASLSVTPRLATTTGRAHAARGRPRLASER